METNLKETKLQLDTCEKERTFFFDKLQKMEFLLQSRGLTNNGIGQDILKVLYAAEDENVTIEEDGKLTIKNAQGVITSTSANAS